MIDDWYLTGRSLFDIIGELSGKTKEFKNVPLICYQEVYTAVEINENETVMPSYEELVDYYDKDDYFDITKIESFDPDEPKAGETDIGDYRVIKVLRFSDGHSVEDLEWE